jgi:hypothetical protein
MSNQLQSTIQKLSEVFAANVIQALRSMSLEEISTLGVGGARRGPGRPPKNAFAAPTHHASSSSRGGSKRLARRSSADLEKMVERIVSLVKSSKKGINAEGIRTALKVPRKVLPRPMAMALASKKIKKKGHKRATMYFSA